MVYNYRDESFDGKYQNLQKSLRAFLRLFQPFQRYKRLKCLTFKSMSKSQSTIFAMSSFHGKYQNLQKLSHTFCVRSNHVRDIKVQIVTFSKYVEVTEYNFRNDTI